MITQGQLERDEDRREAEQAQREMDAELKSHIDRIYSPELIKKLFANALLIDIEDNNEKVDIVMELLGDKFVELGPGTNRLGVMAPDGCCHKIALDRRGIVDNVTEFKRSPELEWCSPCVYETNGVILTVEPVELMTKDEFRANKSNILEICSQLADNYIFTDIGFAIKNFCNWGFRRDGSICILDTGYLIPMLGNESAMECPSCGHKLRYKSTYTGFMCGHCGTEYSFIDVYWRLNSKVEEELYSSISGFELPDFSQFNSTLYNGGLMKGGHIDHDLGRAAREQGQRTVGDGFLRYEDIQDIIRAQGGQE